jgi:hypothetical protein
VAASATEGRQGLAETFQHVNPYASGRDADVLGSLYQALLLGMVTQWLIAPDDVLDGDGLVRAMRLLATGHVDP